MSGLQINLTIDTTNDVLRLAMYAVTLQKVSREKERREIEKPRRQQFTSGERDISRAADASSLKGLGREKNTFGCGK